MQSDIKEVAKIGYDVGGFAASKRDLASLIFIEFIKELDWLVNEARGNLSCPDANLVIARQLLSKGIKVFAGAGVAGDEDN
ncbi:MAG: hypothetical protein S4CHLAM81_00850 [Chlamydiales bacterium]|nr:hypothetical protein [Chlamydiales bacterium]MCH9703706.1 hypothetical protein [Chlamydiota bacterium]